MGSDGEPLEPFSNPGASSAGEAAAIATGMSPLGLGNDGLGSLRHPAQCCGVSALKPTLGRIPGKHGRGPRDSNDRHAANASQRSAGAAGRGPPGSLKSSPGQPGGTLDGARAAPRPRTRQAHPSRHRARPSGLGTAKQVQDGVRKAAHALDQAGYVVDEVEPPSIEAAAKALVVMYATPGIRAIWQQVMPPSLPTPTRRFMSAFFEAAGDPDAVAAEQSFITRQSLLRSWSEFQRHHPLIVAPIATDIPAEAGTDLDEGRVAEDLRTMRMAMAVNASDCLLWRSQSASGTVFLRPCR